MKGFAHGQKGEKNDYDFMGTTKRTRQKGDLKEWLKAERQADKERQLIEDLTCSCAERQSDESNVQDK